MGIFGLILALFVLAISVALTVLISQPFTGALVRLRANYLPKAVSLDNVLEDGASASYGETANAAGVRGVTPKAISGYFLRQQQSAAKIGPVVSGIIAMLQRTKQLEGWAGIYKGSGPVAMQLLVLGFFTLTIFQVGGITGASGGAYRSAPSGPGQFGFWGNLFLLILTSIVALPLNVITNRAIVHPRILTFRKLGENLRELLSYSEYSQPWRLFMVPGLLAAQLTHIFWIGFVTRVVRHITVPSLGGLPPSTPASPGDDTYHGPSGSGTMTFSTFGMAVFLAWCVLSVVVLSPLECVMVRLSVQRPERQQPLHVAYARVSGGGPASYNNQANVPQTSSDSGAGYSDNAGSTAPAEEAARKPSFAIEDEEDEEATGRESKPSKVNGMQSNGPDPSRQNSSARSQPQQVRFASPSAASNTHNGLEPQEPVIALRPCDEPVSAEEAAQAESEGFGAPTVERYTGMIDCLNKLVDEEGIEALYRGAWVTLLGLLAGNFG